VARAAAYDDELDRRQHERMTREVEEAARRHAAVAVEFQARLVRRLEDLLRGEGLRLRPDQLIRWFAVAVVVERLARGLPVPEELWQAARVAGRPRTRRRGGRSAQGQSGAADGKSG
jgi:hypothetical protein